MPIYTTIGEHLVEFTSSSDRMLAMLAVHFPCHVPAEPLGKAPDLVIHIEAGYGVSFVDDEVTITEEPGRIRFRRADYLLVTDEAYREARIFVFDELALKHALMNLYSAYIVHHGWGLLLHSSCVIADGRAHLFAGPSGAGKSTVAKLSHPRELLSDEAALVKITPGHMTVFNSPFRSELAATGREQSSTLASVHLLYQAHSNRRIGLSKSEGLLQLLDKIFYWAHSPEETRKVLHAVHVLAGTVPIYELHFQQNNTFWELIS
ncbi:hypothetical protein CF651_16535 [Paenibacillus rigui]|uniref:Aldolase n=2 Tax=Paenibacillus rigui TaxID=554312 RepID=A0A229UPR6_9BACL|nr:hypothetical protein CF651_16535 [Paenibacillus rigui]